MDKKSITTGIVAASVAVMATLGVTADAVKISVQQNASIPKEALIITKETPTTIVETYSVNDLEDQLARVNADIKTFEQNRDELIARIAEAKAELGIK